MPIYVCECIVIDLCRQVSKQVDRYDRTPEDKEREEVERKKEERGGLITIYLFY